MACWNLSQWKGLGASWRRVGLVARIGILCAGIVCVRVALAHPVTFEGGTAFVSWNQPYMSESWLGYSWSARSAIAARWMRMDGLDETRNQYAIQLNHLLYRHGTPNSQANLYVYGGGGIEQPRARMSVAAGTARSELFEQVVGGFEADWETRRHFALLRSEVMSGRNQKPFHRIEARLGISPYEAKYNEMAAWLMVQVQSNPGLVREQAVTPLVRVFYRTVLIETGVSLEGDWLLNLMMHF